MTDRTLLFRGVSFRPGRLSFAAPRVLLLAPMAVVLLGMCAVFLLPWPLAHRMVLAACLPAAVGIVATEYLARWERLPATAHLLMPALGLLVIGAGMWATGGWGGPLTPFLALPVAHLLIARNVRLALPVALLVGLVALSTGLYGSHGMGWMHSLRDLPVYITRLAVLGILIGRVRSSDNSAATAAEARRQSEARTQDLLTLQRVSSIVAGHLGMGEAIAAIVHELCESLGHSLISIYLYDGTALSLQAQIGYSSYYESMQPGQGVIGSAYESGETIFIRDVAEDAAYLPAEENVRSEIAVALKDDGRVVGVLNVESHDPLTERDRDLMELVGAQVSVVLRNARLTGELRTRAERDPLTDLLNRRTLIEILERTLAVANPACGVLVIDLDGFKAINDAHGHLTGDHILQHVAKILTDTCRSEDYCCRSGGDEFVVVLPRATRAHTEAVANRIAEAAFERPFISPDGARIPLSLSIGQAVAPGDGHTWQDLFTHADQSMYMLKRALVIRSAS